MGKEKEQKQLPSNKIDVTIGQNNYEIKFPTNGQLIEIQRMANRLTDGTGTMLQGGSSASYQAFLLSEACSTFTVLIPQLRIDLNVGSLLDLNPLQSKSLLKAFEKYYEWMEVWRVALNEDVEEDKKEEEKEENE